MTPPPPRRTVSLANASTASSSVQPASAGVDDVEGTEWFNAEGFMHRSLAPPASSGSSCASRNSIASLSGTGYARAPTTTWERRGTGRKSVSNSAASPSHRASASRLGSVALMPMTCSGDGADPVGSRSELAPLSGLARFISFSRGLPSSSPLPAPRAPTSRWDPEYSYELASTPSDDDSAAACINLVNMSSTVLPRLTSWTMCSSSTTTHASS